MLCALLLLSLVATVSGQCSTSCSTDAQCAGCGSSPLVPHTLWTDPAVHFYCISSKCTVLDFTVPSNIATECNLPNGGLCCVYNPILPNNAYDSICAAKQCNTPMDCNPLGFCEYNTTEATVNDCCQTADDCPSTLFFDFDDDDSDGFVRETPLLTACGEYECVANSCRVRKRPSCCLFDANCDDEFGPSPPFGAQDFRCVKDPTHPGESACSIPFIPGESCATDIDCGGDGIANQCAEGDCSGGTCDFSPRAAGALPGCCSASDVSACESTDICLDFTFCDTAGIVLEQHGGGAFATSPTFKCQYNNRRLLGCCTANSDCNTFSDSVTCSTSICNQITNECELLANDPVSGAPCELYSADCGISDPTDMCEYLVSNGAPSIDGSFSAGAFNCEERQIPACPGSPPLDGLVPDLDIALIGPANCTWTCGGEDENTIRQVFRITNPYTAFNPSVGRPLYGFDLRGFGQSASGGVPVVNDLFIERAEMISSSPVNALLVRPVPANLFQAFANDRIETGTSVAQRFSRSQDFALFPGEVIEIEMSVTFTGSLLLDDIILGLDVIKIEPCTDYYYGSPGAPMCNSVADFLTPIERGIDIGPATTVEPGAGSCSAQCIDAPPTPAPTDTPAPTPAPPVSPTPLPTPAPTSANGLPPVDEPVCPLTMTFPVVSPTIDVGFFSAQMDLMPCAWNCSDLLDGAANRITVRIRKTGGALLTQPFQAMQVRVERILSISTSELIDSSLTFTANNADFDGELIETPIPFLPPFPPPVFESILATDGAVILPGESLDIYASAMIDPTESIAPGDTIAVIATAFDRFFPCTVDTSADGFCDNSEIGNDVIAAFVFVQTFQFDDKCPELCEPQLNTVPRPIIEARGFCQWECSENVPGSEPNTYRIEQCIEYGDSGTLPVRVDFVTSKVQDHQVFVDGSARLEFNGEVYSPLVVEPGTIIPLASEESTFRIPGGLVLNSGDAPVCWNFTYVPVLLLVDQPLCLEFLTTAYTLSRCSIVELQSGACPPGSRLYAGTLSEPDIFNNTLLVPDNFPGDNGGLQVIEPIGSPSVTLTKEECSNSCIYNDLLAEEVGGIVFFDEAADGSLGLEPGSLDQKLIGIQVSAVDALSAFSTVLGVTSTDANGVYRFNRTLLYPTGAEVVYFRAVIPSGLVSAPLGTSGNTFLDNDAYDDVALAGHVRTDDTTRDSTASTETSISLVSLNFAFSPFVCEPPLGPLGESDAFEIGCALDECDTCQAPQLGSSADGCAVVCAAVPGAEYRRVRVTKTFANYDSVARSASAVNVEFHTPSGPVRCAEPREVHTDSRVTLLQLRRPTGAGPVRLPARASYALPSMAVGDSYSVQLDFGVCFEPGVEPQLNITAMVYSDECLDRVREWRTCVDETLDVSDCYQELVPDLSDPAVCADCPIPGPGETLPPGATLPPGVTPQPTPAPTFGPPGANTELETSVEFSREDKFCVSRRRIDSFLCEDDDIAHAACQASEANRTVVVVDFTLAMPLNATGPSGSGTLRVKLLRDMQQSLLTFCRAQYDPQVRLTVRNSTGEITDNFGTAKVIESDVTGNNLATIDVAFAPLDPGASVRVSVRALECAGAAPIDYEASARLISAACFDEQLCTVLALHDGPVSELDVEADGCVPLEEHGDFSFASCRSPGMHAVTAYEHIMIGSNGPSETLMYVLCAIALLVVAALCCVFVFSRRSRRRRAGRRPSRRQTKRVTFD